MYKLYRHTWREKLVQLAMGGYGYEEFQRNAKEVIPEEYANTVIPQLPIIYTEIQCEQGMLGLKEEVET